MGTREQIGRHLVLSPENSGLCTLRHARIIGTATSGPIEFATGDCETVLICVRGRGFVLVADELYELALYDALYVPRAMDIRVDADGEGCELLEAAAPVTADYPVQFVPWEDVSAGGTDCTVLLGNNVQTGRIRAGFTVAGSGGWSGTPVAPALHFEQIQVYVDVPEDAWGVAVYGPECVRRVRQDDCVAIPDGEALTIAGPGARIGFVWFLSAHQESEGV